MEYLVFMVFRVAGQEARSALKVILIRRRNHGPSFIAQALHRIRGGRPEGQEAHRSEGENERRASSQNENQPADVNSVWKIVEPFPDR
jgi:hypothetical protein